MSAMGRPESFDPRTDPIVRVSLGSVRERLQSYFGAEGRQEKIQMEIPLGQYRLVFSEAPRDVKPVKTQRQLAGPVLAAIFFRDAANIIVYTEPLFFRDDSGRYFRDWNINSLPAGQAEIPNRFTGITAERSTARFSLPVGWRDALPAFDDPHVSRAQHSGGNTQLAQCDLA